MKTFKEVNYVKTSFYRACHLARLAHAQAYFVRQLSKAGSLTPTGARQLYRDSEHNRRLARYALGRALAGLPTNFN